MTIIDLRDGELRPIKFGALALSRFELLICSGTGFYSLLEGILNSRPPFYVMSGLLWAGLGGEISHEEVCRLFDNYVARSGDKYDGHVWEMILEALKEAGVFRDGEKKVATAPLRDPRPEPEIEEPPVPMEPIKEEPQSSDAEYEARIERLKKERKDRKRQMGANL